MQSCKKSRNLSTTCKLSPPVFLTEREVAKVLRVQPKTLTTWRSDGEDKLPSHQLGRLVRYRIRDVAEYLLKNKNQ